jgi:hypothetical protein
MTPAAPSTTAGERVESEDGNIQARSSPCVFRREGEYWTLIYADQVCRLRDTLGLRLLSCLLTRAGERLSAVGLLATVAGANDAADASPTDGPATDPRRAEHARVNATRALKSALRRVSANHPTLSAHLTATVRTGMYCVYHPDPRVPIEWQC